MREACPLCKHEKILFEPPLMYCTACGTKIKRNTPYWTQTQSDPQAQITRAYWCNTCFNREGPQLQVDGATIPKSEMEKKKNDEEVEEAWVQCDKCSQWFHQICCLFNNFKEKHEASDSTFVCPICLVQEGPKR